MLELHGALAYAPFEVLIGAGKRFGRRDARCDVGERSDDAAIRHVVDAHLDDKAAIGKAFQEWLEIGPVARQPLAHQCCGIAGSESTMLGVEAENFGKIDADAHYLIGQLEQLAELPVPANKVRILVEYRNALAHMIERGLQNFAVVVDGGIGIVEQL